MLFDRILVALAETGAPQHLVDEFKANNRGKDLEEGALRYLVLGGNGVMFTDDPDTFADPRFFVLDTSPLR